MSYIINNIAPNESIVFETKIHSFYKMLCIFFICLSGGFSIALFLGSEPPIGFGPILFALGFAYQYVALATMEFAVTSSRVLRKDGILSLNVAEMGMKKIESVNLRQSFFQRIIGAGDVYISGTGGNIVLFDNVDNPQEVREKIQSVLETTVGR